VVGKMSWNVWKLMFGLACTAAIGCSRGSEGPETASATGTVTYKGAPVAGAVVVFRPDGNGDVGQAAETSTGDDGTFVMHTSLGRGEYKAGAVPGNYLVEIRKVEPPQNDTQAPRSLLPAKYGTARTSGLTANVELAGANEFKFELVD
jgi:hypothetical protein